MAAATFSFRARRIGLTNERLASLAKCDPHTVRRFLADKADTRRSKVRAIESALEAEEIALRDHLLALHPVQTMEAAA